MTAGSILEWAARALAGIPDPLWTLREDGYDPLLERETESRFSIGNGFLGVRGSLEFPMPASRPRTYVAGLYGAVPGAPANPSLVSAPDWLRLSLAVDGEELDVTHGRAARHSRTLDLRFGLLRTAWDHCLPSGRLVRIRTLRLVSFHDRRLCLQVVQIEPADRATLALEALLAPVSQALSLERAEGRVSLWRTAAPERGLALGADARLYAAGGTPVAAREDGLRRRWAWTAAAGEAATLVRTAAVAKFDGASRTGRQAAREVSAALRRAPPAVFAAHVRGWSERWQAADVRVDGNEATQRALRFAVYHLLSAVNPEDERSSVGARGLTGDAYSGHVFWDTEIFLLPFYTLTWPEAARALLMYRYHTLPAARAKAAGLGYEGAFYAWESADTGEETAPTSVMLPSGEALPILSGLQECHISADIAFAVWRYWQATADTAFLLDAGAEILLETARFWASRATLEADGRYHIRGVMGPDEYHDGVDDNAYTNGMAQWNLETGLAAAHLVRSRWPDHWHRLRDRLRLHEEELNRWRDVAARIALGLDPAERVLEQFHGFFHLEPVNLADYEPRSAPLDVLLGRARTQRSQVIKQADVVMLLALLWERFPPAVREASFRYYEPRCGHGSSLDPAVHALVAAKLGDLPLAEEYLRETASIDLGNTMGNVAGGVHLGALGGLWQAVIFGFGGLSLTAEGPSFEPRLPGSWRSLSFQLRWRGSRLGVAIRRDPPELTVSLHEGPPVTVAAAGRRRTLVRGEAHTWPLGAAAPGGRG